MSWRIVNLIHAPAVDNNLIIRDSVGIIPEIATYPGVRGDLSLDFLAQRPLCQLRKRRFVALSSMKQTINWVFSLVDKDVLMGRSVLQAAA